MGPGVGSRFSLEVLLSVDLDWVEPIGVHPRRIKHYVIRRAVTRLAIRLITVSSDEMVYTGELRSSRA